MNPHRKAPPIAQLSLEIDGVPYTAQVTLTVGQPVKPKRSVALTVVQPPKLETQRDERATCQWCAFSDNISPLQCSSVQLTANGEHPFTNRVYLPDCAGYRPSLLTRWLRAFRLGRAPVYLASPEPTEPDSSAPEKPSAIHTRTGMKTGKRYV